MTFPIGRSSTAEPDVRAGEAWKQQIHGRLNEAVEMFREIVKTWPDHIDGNFGLGLALKTAGQREEAMQYFQTAYNLADAEMNKQMEDSSRYQMIRRMAQQHLGQHSA